MQPCDTMLVTLLYCSLRSMTLTCVSEQLVYRFSLCPRCVWKIRGWEITISIRNFFWRLWFVETSCLVAGDSRTRKLSVENYQLFIEVQWCYNNIFNIFIERNFHFIILKLNISLVWRHPTILLRHNIRIITRSLTFIMFLFYLNQTYETTWIHFIYIWASCLP